MPADSEEPGSARQRSSPSCEEAQQADAPFRIGLGWDRHRLAPIAEAGGPLILGGIPFDHESGPVGHSDGDALLHALTDAILGALGGPDIGQLFPDDDPSCAGADSAVFLAEALRRARQLGWAVVNADSVVVLERPKIAPVKEAIRANLARLLGVSLDAVNIKGKTGEGVDAVGEGRAVEAQAVVLLTRTPTASGEAT